MVYLVYKWYNIWNNIIQEQDAMSAKLSLEIYQYYMHLSTGKIKNLPTITKMAEGAGVSRQMIYLWASGKRSCKSITEYLKSVTGINFPVKLKNDEITKVRILLRIC